MIEIKAGNGVVYFGPEEATSVVERFGGGVAVREGYEVAQPQASTERVEDILSENLQDSRQGQERLDVVKDTLGRMAVESVHRTHLNAKASRVLEMMRNRRNS